MPDRERLKHANGLFESGTGVRGPPGGGIQGSKILLRLRKLKLKDLDFGIHLDQPIPKGDALFVMNQSLGLLTPGLVVRPNQVLSSCLGVGPFRIVRASAGRMLVKSQ